MKPANNKKTVVLLVALVIGMFGFGFAMVPLYNLICQVTGLKSIGQVRIPIKSQVDETRTVLVEFDGVVNDNLPWKFEPSQRQIKVNTGKVTTVSYKVTNLSDKTVTGQAIPSVIPWFGNKYFNKIECFCFNNQTLEPNQTVDMPIQFFISPDMPKDINTLRLSYTFMNTKV